MLKEKINRMTNGMEYDMNSRRRLELPPIGMRIVKSAAAVFICFVISFLRGNSGIVFYSQLAALWCIQIYVSNTRENAIQRFIGTVVGAVYGLLFLLLERRLAPVTGYVQWINGAGITLMVVVILYTTVLLKKKQASYFSCVVFLSIAVNHIGDANPYLFVWNRFLDTVIGIAVGMAVNMVRLPKKKHRDILFVSGLDDTLLNQGDMLSDYARVELNRMLDDGMNFTLSTMRTPASLMEPMRDVRLRLPVIAMDGAVLYDIREKMFLKVYVIAADKAKRLYRLIREAGIACFANVIIDDMLAIYYEELTDETQINLVKELRRSPYRNYVQRRLPEGQEVVYFMLLDRRERMERFYEGLAAQGITEECKVLFYDSQDYPGYSYIKIYSRNAKKENMMDYLKNLLGLEKIVTFGSVEGKYDVVVKSGDTNRVVHMLKKMYETFR